MQRNASFYLSQWVKSPLRKPLVIRGARQVGKSTLVRQLASSAFEQLIEIDLEVESEVAQLFKSKDPVAIVNLLEAKYEVDIRFGTTLLFLDEIQAAPEVFACLRYFHEKLPELHVIAAGSLLDLALANAKYSMPVGRIEYLYLGPMSFEEFLLAMNRTRLLKIIRQYSIGQEMSPMIHQELMAIVRKFFIVGGMPESVSAFIKTKGHKESEAAKEGLLQTYREDFLKYGSGPQHARLSKLLLAIPKLVGNKFMYSNVDRMERPRELGQALSLLCLSRVVSKVRHSDCNGLPLGAEANDRHFKMLLLDVGLLCRSTGLSLYNIEEAEHLEQVNSGALCEQFVGQHLLYMGELFAEPEIYYWTRQKSQSNAEVDYVISLGPTILPVEVKAGSTGALKSLHSFVQRKNLHFAVRMNSAPPSLAALEATVAGDSLRYQLLSLPFYLIGQVSRLCQESFC